jgi:hypothetical protein
MPSNLLAKMIVVLACFVFTGLKRFRDAPFSHLAKKICEPVKSKRNNQQKFPQGFPSTKAVRNDAC